MNGNSFDALRFVYFQTLLFKEELAVANAAASATGAHGLATNASGSMPSTSTAADTLAAGLKNTEVISILKRRNNSSENIHDNLKYTSSSTPATMAAAPDDNSISVHSQTYSDHSAQKYGDADEDDDDDSDSDWDGFQDSQRSSSGFDMSDMASSFFREISDVLLSK